MSSVFMNDMKRDMAEDAALTVQRPRQSFAEDRSPDENIEFQSNDMDFIFDGLLEAMRRRSM